MNKQNAVRVSRASGMVLGVATILVAALLIFQCADIYLMGTGFANMTQTGVLISDVYSPEIVSQRFNSISWAFVLWLAALVFALIARAIAKGEERVIINMTPEIMLGIMLTRKIKTPAMRAEEKRRAWARAACACICGACAIAIMAYFLNLENFVSRDLEKVLGAMLLTILPPIAVAFLALAAFSYYSGKSASRETEAAKNAPVRNPEPQKATKKTAVIAMRAAIIILAAALITAGALNGGMYDVLVKAANICTECIGLG